MTVDGFNRRCRHGIKRQWNMFPDMVSKVAFLLRYFQLKCINSVILFPSQVVFLKSILQHNCKDFAGLILLLFVFKNTSTMQTTCV